MHLLDVIEAKLGQALGIRPRRGSRALLERAIERMRSDMHLGLDEIARRIDTDPLLVRRLAGAITVEETFFFRHPEHFDLLVDHVRGELARAPSQPIVVWSAGCSSGEEPYSMAIALQRAFGPAFRQRVRIVASDIDDVSLEKARRAVYGRWSFRGTDAALRAEAFESVGNDEYRLRAPLREAVEFVHLSLDHQVGQFGPSSIDVVFFRNVGIYLTDPALERFFRGLSRVVKPGGLLVLGPADPIPPGAELDHVRVERGLTVVRSLPPVPPEQRPASAAFAPARTVTAAPLPTRASPLPAVSPRPRTSPTPPTPPTSPSSAALAIELADRGRFDEAIDVVDRALATEGSSASLLGVRGRILLASGAVDRGVDDLRSALFLSSSDVFLRFHYAIGLEMQNRHRAARSQLLDVLRALEASCDDDLLSDGETSASDLRRAAAELLRRIE